MDNSTRHKAKSARSLEGGYLELRLKIRDLRTCLRDFHKTMPYEVSLPENLDSLSLGALHKCALAISDMNNDFSHTRERGNYYIIPLLEDLRDAVHEFGNEYIGVLRSFPVLGMSESD